MIDVKIIDLNSRGIILPSDCVGMVIAQPYLSLTAEEPYRCLPAAKAGQLDVLSRTLVISRAAHHGAPKTHFTIFPEYSVPGLEGIAVIDGALGADDWPPATFVIGGTDALSKTDFLTLSGFPNTHLDTEGNALNRILNTEWINCAITWVKGNDGMVERWLQPKLSPAWPEQNVCYQDMFRGRSAFAFKGPLNNGAQYRFSTLVCFDWIATVDHLKPWRWVVDALRLQLSQAGGDETSLSWLFVIQSNRKPSDAAFLSEVQGFFDQTAYPTVRRERACLVFANSAGKAGPGRADLYGSTSLIFSGQTLFSNSKCRPTFCNGGARFRSSTLLSAFRDVLFREHGACVHSFAQVNPNSVSAGAAGKILALNRAYVFPVSDSVDPRAPSAGVPASIKWLNDELDSLPSLSAQYPAAPLAGQVAAIHEETVAALRAISAQSATRAVRLAAADSKAELADEWECIEGEGVKHLVHSLDIVALGFSNPAVGTDSAHATLNMNGQSVDLLAIRGKTHELCIDHSKPCLASPHRQALLVSRDVDNTPWKHKFGSFLEPITPRLGQERMFTNPQEGLLHLGYEKLLAIFRDSPTPAALQGAISAELGA